MGAAWRRAAFGLLMLVTSAPAGWAAEEPLPCNKLCRMWMGAAAPPLPEEAKTDPGPALALPGALLAASAPVPVPVPVSRPLDGRTVAGTARRDVPLPPKRPPAPRREPVQVASAVRPAPIPVGRPDPVALVAAVALPPSQPSPVPVPQEPSPAAIEPVVAMAPPAPPAPPATPTEPVSEPAVALVPPSRGGDAAPPRPIAPWPPGLDVIATVLLSVPPR